MHSSCTDVNSYVQTYLQASNCHQYFILVYFMPQINVMIGIYFVDKWIWNIVINVIHHSKNCVRMFICHAYFSENQIVSCMHVHDICYHPI